jgi:hypothetical protein
MSNFYDKEIIAQSDCKLTEQLAYESRKTIEDKLGITKFNIFFVLFGIFLLILIGINYKILFSDLFGIILFSLIFIFAAGLIYWYTLGIYKKLQKKITSLFNSTQLLNQQFNIKLYRDKFIFKSQYETIDISYSETVACIECDEFFVIVIDHNKKNVVILKKDINDKGLNAVKDAFGKRLLKQKGLF